METLSYDSKHRNISSIYYRYDKGALHTDDSISTIYSDTAKSYIEYSSWFLNDTLRSFTKTEYVLNDSGDITTSTSFFSTDGGITWSNSRLKVYEYDSKGWLSLVNTYYYENKYWREYYQDIYKYSDTVTEYITLRSINGEWTNDRKTVRRFKKIETSADNEFSGNYDFKVDVSPNPASTTLNINYEMPYEGAFSLNIFDCSGKLSFSIPVSNQSEGSHSLKIRVSNMLSGVYFCEFNINGRKIIRQFIIYN
jgi:hypothetical protein